MTTRKLTARQRSTVEAIVMSAVDDGVITAEAAAHALRHPEYQEPRDLPGDLAPASDEALFHFQVIGEIGFALVAMDAIDDAIGNMTASAADAVY